MRDREREREKATNTECRQREAETLVERVERSKVGDTLLMSPAIPTSFRVQCTSCSFVFCQVFHFFSLTLHSELYTISHRFLHYILGDTYVKTTLEKYTYWKEYRGTDREMKI